VIRTALFLTERSFAPAASGVALFIALAFGFVLSGSGFAALAAPEIMALVGAVGLVSGVAALRNGALAHSGLSVGVAAILVGANGLVLRWAVHVLGIAIVLTPKS
jgi:hypothetical protein